MAYTPKQIVEFIEAGDGPNGMYEGSYTTGDLAGKHQEIVEEMRKTHGAMLEHWEGDAAAQAFIGVAPVVQASEVNGNHLQQARDLYSEQGSSFGRLYNAIAEIGPLGEEPKGDWASSTALSFMTNRADEIKVWQAKGRRIVENYDLYYRQSAENSDGWVAPSQYREVRTPVGGAGIKSDRDDNGRGRDRPPPWDVGKSFVDNRPKDVIPPGAVVPGQSVVPPGGVIPSGVVPPGSEGKPGEPRVSDGSDLTRGAGVSESGSTAIAGSPAIPNTFSGAGALSNQGDSGSAGLGAGIMAGGGFGPIGSGASSGSDSGARSGNVAGGGRNSGAGLFREPMTAVPRVGGPTIPGPAGAGGMPMGPMGQGRANGDEDSEHRAPSYLLEPDPENALIGELPRATPPVIGG